MRKTLSLLLLMLLACLHVSIMEAQQLAHNIIPMPAKAVFGQGEFNLQGQKISMGTSTSSSRPELARLSQLLATGVHEACGIKLPMLGKGGKVQLVLSTQADKQPESYTLEVNNRGVQLKSSSAGGLFYGMQTLLQLVGPNGRVPFCNITDAPAFEYRGLHLDVSRHFMSVDYIKQMLDLMATYKFNRFHWHLTDGGGWRMESKKYPLLTELAQARMVSDWDGWWSQGDRKFVPTGTPGSYGGFYTQQQIRDVVKYAQDRYITIIPEIEMPGHSNEVFAAYPELNCLGRWDYNCSEFCIGNPKTFEFLQNILDEVLELFPSKYIHIGGDEASKEHWAKCLKCQALMKKEGLKNEKELQSYCIKKIETYLNQKGRRIIGWDEILEGGLAPDATVMSWRGEEGGKTAAKMKHHVIMTPGNPLYFDFYQSNPLMEPKAIGGYNPLKKVYEYNPRPADLSADEQAYIIGAQANLWTEFVPDEAHAAYMTWPRALAVAELLWTPVANKDYPNFLKRANVHTNKMIKRGINAFPMKNIDLTMAVDTVRKEIKIYADTERIPSELRYTLDGTAPNAQSPLYDSVIVVKDSARLMIQLFEEGKPLFKPLPYQVDYHKALGKKVTYNNPYNNGYPAGGDTALTDGYRGSWTYLDQRWQGFTRPMDVVIDLGSLQPLHSVRAKFMQVKGAWVYMPSWVELLVSADGVNYQSVGKKTTSIDVNDMNLRFEEFNFHTNQQARYVRMKAEQEQIKNYFLFVDEIIVY